MILTLAVLALLYPLSIGPAAYFAVSHRVPGKPILISSFYKPIERFVRRVPQATVPFITYLAFWTRLTGIPKEEMSWQIAD